MVDSFWLYIFFCFLVFTFPPSPLPKPWGNTQLRRWYWSYLMLLTSLVKVLGGLSSLFFRFSSFPSCSTSQLPTFLILLWHLFPFLSPNSLLTLHSRGLHVSWFDLVSSWGKGFSWRNSCCYFLGRGRVTSFSPPCIYILYKCTGVFGELFHYIFFPLLVIPELVVPPSQALSRGRWFGLLDFVQHWLTFC